MENKELIRGILTSVLRELNIPNKLKSDITKEDAMTIQQKASSLYCYNFVKHQTLGRAIDLLTSAMYKENETERQRLFKFAEETYIEFLNQ